MGTEQRMGWGRQPIGGDPAIRQLPVAADDAADLGEGVRGNVPERLDVLDVVDEELGSVVMQW
jgi:hypothetical protein